MGETECRNYVDHGAGGLLTAQGPRGNIGHGYAFRAVGPATRLFSAPKPPDQKDG